MRIIDWSSDVCSSELYCLRSAGNPGPLRSEKGVDIGFFPIARIGRVDVNLIKNILAEMRILLSPGSVLHTKSQKQYTIQARSPQELFRIHVPLTHQHLLLIDLPPYQRNISIESLPVTGRRF